MHSNQTDRIRQAERYYSTHERFAPGEEAAVEAARARAEERQAEEQGSLADLYDHEVNLAKDIGSVLFSAAAGINTKALSSFDSDAVLAIGITWAAQVWDLCPEILEDGRLESVFHGIALGLEALPLESRDGVVTEILFPEGDGRSSEERTADRLGAVLSYAALGLALVPEISEGTDATARWETTARSWASHVESRSLPVTGEAAVFLEIQRVINHLSKEGNAL